MRFLTSHNDILVIKEKFDQPSFLVKFCNFKSCEMLGVGEKSKLAFFFLVIESNESE